MELGNQFVDTAEFERTIRRYAEAGKKDLEYAMWKGASNWAWKALAYMRGQPSAKTHMIEIPTDRDKNSPNWRLVRWLATKAVAAGAHTTVTTERDWRYRTTGANGYIAGKTRRVREYTRDPDTGKMVRVSIYRNQAEGFLTEFAKQETRSRNRSCGYIKSLLLGLAKSAKKRAAVIQGTGIRAESVGELVGSVVKVACQSVYRYDYPMTRAYTFREESGIDMRAERAFAITLPATIADMNEYIQRKIEEAALKNGHNGRNI